MNFSSFVPRFSSLRFHFLQNITVIQYEVLSRIMEIKSKNVLNNKVQCVTISHPRLLQSFTKIEESIRVRHKVPKWLQ